MRAARSVTSGKNFGDFLMAAPLSIEGASSKPGAVQFVADEFHDRHSLHGRSRSERCVCGARALCGRHTPNSVDAGRGLTDVRRASSCVACPVEVAAMPCKSGVVTRRRSVAVDNGHHRSGSMRAALQADQAEPVRRQPRGAKRSAAGMGVEPIPWRASAARGLAGTKASEPGKLSISGAGPLPGNARSHPVDAVRNCARDALPEHVALARHRALPRHVNAMCSARCPATVAMRRR